MDFELSGYSYKCGTIDARKQFHIVRRLLPVISGVVQSGMDSGGLVKGKPSLEYLSGKGSVAIEAIASAIGKLSDEDADYVIFGLLACVTRKQENGLGWAKVSNGNAMMFADIGMADMLKLAYSAFEANMQDFFAVIRSILKEQQQPQSAQ